LLSGLQFSEAFRSTIKAAARYRKDDTARRPAWSLPCTYRRLLGMRLYPWPQPDGDPKFAATLRQCEGLRARALYPFKLSIGEDWPLLRDGWIGFSASMVCWVTLLL